MKLYELFEGRVKDLAITQDYDRLHGPGPAITTAKSEPGYRLTVNGKPWGNFSSEKQAQTAARTLQTKNPRIRINVEPIKKDPKVF